MDLSLPKLKIDLVQGASRPKILADASHQEGKC